MNDQTIIPAVETVIAVCNSTEGTHTDHIEAIATTLARSDQFTAAFLNVLADQIHMANVDAGWWTNLATGESTLETRNVGEMLCLIHSEVSEGMEGHRKKLMDDKLPHRPMLQTELVDAFVRTLDLCGSRQRLERLKAQPVNGFGDIFVEKVNFNRTREDHKIENRLKEGGKSF